MNRSRVTGDLASHGNIFVDIANDRVGIGTTIPRVKLDSRGDVTIGAGGENSALGVRFNSAYAQIKLPDGQTGANRKGNLSFGDNDDFRIVHDGHHNYITAGTGSIYVSTSSANPVNISNSSVDVNVDLTVTDTTADSVAGPEFKLFRNSASPADADYLGQIKFAGENDNNEEINYAKITGKILDASDGTEDGIIEFAHIKAGSETITGRWRSDSLQLLNGTNLTVAGTVTATGGLYGDGSNITALNGSNIASGTVPVARIGTGTKDTTTFYRGDGTFQVVSTDLVGDTSPQLGGNLDTNGSYIFTSQSNGNIPLQPNGAGSVEIKGAGGNDGTLQLNCSANSHGIKLKSPPHSAGATYTLTFPNTDGNSNQVLKTDGSGNLDWVDQTAINNNADNRVITGSGTANTLNAESTLTFSDRLTVNVTPNQKILLQGSTHPYIHFFEGTTGKAFMQWHADGYIRIKNDEDGSVIRIKDSIDFSSDNESSFHSIWHAGNDGSGSGLDADTLDGVQGASFLRSDAADTFNNTLTYSGSAGSTPIDLATVDGYASFRVIRNNTASGSFADGMYIGYSNNNNGITRIYGGGATTGDLSVRGASDVRINNNTVWHAGNDGSGSGLDADTLDGVQGASFLRSDVNDAQALQRIEFLANQTYNYDTIATTNGNQGCIEIGNSGVGNDAYMAFHAGSDYALYFGLDADSNKLAVGGWSLGANKYAIYHEGNKPTESDLGFNYISSNSDDTASGRITFTKNSESNYDDIATTSGSQGSIEIYNQGSGNDAFMAFHTGSDYALYFGLDGDSNRLAVGGWSMGAVKHSIFHEHYATMRGSSAGDGFGIVWSMDGTYAPSSVGHNATHHEGFFWHTTADYGIYRTSGNWSGNYQQLRLDWPTGIVIDGGTQYGLSGCRFECSALPTANNTYNLGSSSLRWANVYTNDLNLSNEGSANEVDGTWGNFTIQEGEDDLFLINKRNGKKYKFNLTEV